MIVTLYYNNSDPHTAVKELSKIADLECTLVEESSAVDPVISLDIDPIEIDMSLVNYFEIPFFHRKYSVTDPAVVVNGFWNVRGHCDILSSAYDYYIVKGAYIERQEGANPLIADELLTTYSDPITTTQVFPAGLSSPEYVLTVVSSTPSKE